MPYNPSDLITNMSTNNIGSDQEEHQGYMPEKNGPFRCDNCEYYAAKNDCNNSIVKSWAKKGMYGLTLLKNGDAKVDPGGCSDEFEPKSESDDSSEDDLQGSDDSDTAMNNSMSDLPMRRPNSKMNFGG